MARYCMRAGLLHANNKSALQHAHPRNLISAFDIHSLYIKIANIHSFNITFEPRHEISNNVVCATSGGSDQPVHTRSLSRAFAGRLNIL